MILGAGGIIGQHMKVSVPAGVDATFARRADWDVTDRKELTLQLGVLQPRAIVNLAGENRPDVVERNPGAYRAVNVEVPAFLSAWCEKHGAHLVQVSTQAVFGGLPLVGSNGLVGMRETFYPPFSPESLRMPVNAYGAQKLAAEAEVSAAGKRWTIVRPTFVLGVRPDPSYGRENPVEQMLAPVQQIVEGETHATMRQVCDRWFSVSFAWEVARVLWEVAMGEPQRHAIHVGIPYRTNRHIIASYLRPDLTVEPVSHDSFEGLAPRPIDTTYAGEIESKSRMHPHPDRCYCGNCRDEQGKQHPVMVCYSAQRVGSFAEIAEGLDRCKAEYEARELVTKCN